MPFEQAARKLPGQSIPPAIIFLNFAPKHWSNVLFPEKYIFFLLHTDLKVKPIFFSPDKKIPYVIGDGFNETAMSNIHEAINNYNTLFENCIRWTPRATEVLYPNG